MKAFIILALLTFSLCGCTTTKTLEARKQERYGAYSQLAPETRALVDQGNLAVGMSSDAVYIAWGKPFQVVHSESSEGRLTTWLYHGSYLHEYEYWRYSYAPGPRGRMISPLPYLETGYAPRGYIRGEVIFLNDLVHQWRRFEAPPF